jgi:hypothetical protein
MFAVLSQNRSKHGWTQTTPFHGGNWGSNPHGDANFPKGFRTDLRNAASFVRTSGFCDAVARHYASRGWPRQLMRRPPNLSVNRDAALP